MPEFDRHDLYEHCVQTPDHVAALLAAIHGNSPLTLGEDFAAGGALSRTWVARDADRSAIAVDLDADVLRRCEGTERIRTIVGDVRSTTNPQRDGADIVFVGNFSIGELHDRAEVVAYLRHARDRLKPGGVFVCDTYGGESAFMTGEIEREHTGPNGEQIIYLWEQRDADPLTGRVCNALHFGVLVGDEVVQELNDAFVYDWRLWSVPELRDMLRDAGFASTEVYAQVVGAMDAEGNAYVEPITDPDDLEDSFIVYVVGRD